MSEGDIALLVAGVTGLVTVVGAIINKSRSGDGTSQSETAMRGNLLTLLEASKAETVAANKRAEYWRRKFYELLVVKGPIDPATLQQLLGDGTEGDKG